jgi:hypothetical protein
LRRDGRLVAPPRLAQAMRIAWRFRLDKTVHGRPLPPIADEIGRASMGRSFKA